LPEQGSFVHDKPFRVVSARLGEDKIITVTIEWDSRVNGTKPKNSQFTSKVVRDQCPQLLVDFYETRINLKKPP
jgi:hypothetical protein